MRTAKPPRFIAACRDWFAWALKPPVRFTGSCACSQSSATSCGSEIPPRFVPAKYASRRPMNATPGSFYRQEIRLGGHARSRGQSYYRAAAGPLAFNSPSVTLPAAARTGRLTLVSDAVVSHVLMNDQGKAEGVGYVERTTREHREARAKIVVLAAAALESTRILLN